MENLVASAEVESARLQAVEQLANNLTHDFNNILTPLVGYAELICQDPQLGAKSRRIAERIDQGANRAVEILRRLELFFREASRAPAVAVSWEGELSSAVAEVLCATTAETGAQHTIRLELNDAPVVLADPVELRQLAIELLTNACDASAVDEEIVVRLEQRRQLACLTITDRGVGMTPAQREQCQEPFQTTKTTAGAGLGLSACRGIVRRLSGTLHIESQPGAGTVVQVMLPVLMAPVD